MRMGLAPVEDLEPRSSGRVRLVWLRRALVALVFELRSKWRSKGLGESERRSGGLLGTLGPTRAAPCAELVVEPTDSSVNETVEPALPRRSLV